MSSKVLERESSGTDEVVVGTPHETLYVNNLNHKLKDPVIKKKLREVFEKYGTILQIVSSCYYHLRGQAWVVFDNVESSQKALKEMQGFEFYGRPMRIAFAKAKSDPTTKREGTYKIRDKETYVHPGPIKGAALERLKLAQAMEQRNAPPVEETIDPSKPLTAIPRPLKRLPPNKILIAEELPPTCDKESLQSLFEPFVGLKDVRVIPTKSVAFIEFETESQAGQALMRLSNYELSPTNLLFLNFALK